MSLREIKECEKHGLVEFYVIKRKGRNDYFRCCECRKTNDKNRYNRYAPNRVKSQQVRALSIHNKKRQFIWDYYSTHPCVMCGETDPIVLEFDHLDPKKKSFEIGTGTSSKGIRKIEEEIGKCQVLCANCHHRKTASSQGWYKGVLQ